METIEHKDYLKKLRPMKTPANKMSKDRYCCFHRDHGHDTKECHQLKEEIQELINCGFLRRFVAKDNEPQRGRVGDQGPPLAGVVDPRRGAGPRLHPGGRVAREEEVPHNT